MINGANRLQRAQLDLRHGGGKAILLISTRKGQKAEHQWTPTASLQVIAHLKYRAAKFPRHMAVSRLFLVLVGRSLPVKDRIRRCLRWRVDVRVGKRGDEGHGWGSGVGDRRRLRGPV